MKNLLCYVEADSGPLPANWKLPCMRFPFVAVILHVFNIAVPDSLDVTVLPDRVRTLMVYDVPTVSRSETFVTAGTR